MTLAVLLALTLCPPDVPAAAAPVFSAPQVEAAFLYNFAKFVEWPDSAFSTAESPFILGFLGPDPVADAARQLLRGKSVGGRSLVVREVDLETAKSCHILFVGRVEEARLAAIVAALRGDPVLLVSDMERFAGRGGMIGLVTAGQKIRFAIDAAAARAAGLTLSSQLLDLARPDAGPAGEDP